MERQTKTIDLGGGFSAKVYTYATAGQSQEIQKVYFNGTKIEVSGQTPRINDFNPSIQFDVQKKLIETLVLSIDDNGKDFPVSSSLDLPLEQYEALLTHLDELTSKKK